MKKRRRKRRVPNAMHGYPGPPLWNALYWCGRLNSDRITMPPIALYCKRNKWAINMGWEKGVRERYLPAKTIAPGNRAYLTVLKTWRTTNSATLCIAIVVLLKVGRCCWESEDNQLCVMIYAYTQETRASRRPRTNLSACTQGQKFSLLTFGGVCPELFVAVFSGWH